MTTEKFSLQEFEDVLKSSVDGLQVLWDGYVGGEGHFQIPVKELKDGKHVIVEIASSVGPSGFADGTGENSIRVWLTGEDGLPLGNKIQRWVTRVAGWQERLADQIDRMVSMGEALQWCEKCDSSEKVFIVKKEGPNKGRIFLKCNCPNSFTWLDETDEEEPAKPVKADAKKPRCPKCGASMQLRTRKSDGHKFWGCSLFPACKGSVDVDEAAPDLNGNVKFTKAIQDADREDEERRCRDKMAMETAANARPAKPTKFTPSDKQLAIFNWVKTSGPGKALVAEARAGSGKTTTGVQMLGLLPRSLDIAFVAFNKHVQMDIKKKAPDYVKVMTYHSLGFAACRQAFGNDITVDNDKVDSILQNILDPMQNRGLYAPIKSLVSLVKANLVVPTVEELTALADYHGIDLNGEEDTIFAAVQMVIERDAQITNIIDYDDQCWLPIFLDLPMHLYDFVFIDEAQDTNKCQAALALSSIKESGRIVAVGDRYQSLYGFRGADVNAIPNLIEELEADVLPLSITYRNPKCVVRLCNEKFPEIDLECPDWADEGLISNISENRALMEFRSGDMVLCRTNAPLVPPAFELIRKGVKAVIRGRDIGKGLTVLIRKMKAHDLTDLLVKLAEYREKEVAKLTEAKKNSQAQTVMDKVDTIVALADGIFSISEVEDRIDTIFSDDEIGVIFSSVHRAKGLEAERVFILHPELMPHPMAKKDWEKVQERNIEYVAITRTLRELYFVGG